MDDCMNKFFVYSYAYPDGTVYYVGKGCGSRHRVHIRDAKAGRNAGKFAVRVTKKILDSGEIPLICIIQDKMSEEDSLSLEVELIAKYGRRDNGTGILTNCTDGGDRGASGLSPELKARQVAGLIEWTTNFRIVDAEYKKKISEGLRAYYAINPVSDERRDKLRKIFSGSSNPFYGQNHSEESRLKISQALSGRRLTGEHKESVRRSMTGKHKGSDNPFYGQEHTEQSLRKMSDSANRVVNSLKESGLPHWNTGRKLSEDHLAKLRVERECPHCGKIGKGSAMNRYHFNKCNKIVSVV